MKAFIAKRISVLLDRIAAYFAATASPMYFHRPELPEELKK